MVSNSKAQVPMALRISGIYMVLAAIYVLGLDYVLDVSGADRDALVFWQQVKGGGFVLLTGLFLFVSLIFVLRKQGQYEAQLEAEQERLYEVLETIPAYVYLQGRDYGIRYANREFRRRFGDPEQGPCYKVMQDLEEPCKVCPTFDAFSKEGPVSWEFHDPTNNRYFEVHDMPMRDANGEEVVLEMGFDVTDRKKTEQTLRQLSVVVEQSPVSILITDREGRIEYANPKCVETSGYSLRELIGENPRIFQSGEQDAELYRTMWEELDQGKTWNGEFCNKRKDGALYYERATISPLRNQQGETTHFIALKEDVSNLQAMLERHDELERQFRQAQKLEALGTLAGGIAHDFNNILSAILGFTELGLMNLKEGDPLQSDLEQIRAAGNRARDLVRQILTFSRSGEQERHPVQVDLVAKEAFKLLRSSLPATIEMRLCIDDGSPTVLADPSQLHQVFMNLGTNAYQAMGEQGGLLTLAVRSVDLAARRAERLGLAPGPYLEVEVSDTGCGIPDELREKVFDPFFTTKDVGKGTGLGLSTVHGIVTSHGGAVELVTAEDEGTAFRLYFPRIEEKEMNEGAPETPIRGGHETILLVDDEPAVAQTLKRHLSLLGYRVVVCSTAEDAIRRVRKNRQGFDIAIVDQVLQDTTGVALARELHGISPSMPVIAITGHSEEVTAESARKLGFSGFLLKPFQIEELAATIRAACNNAHADRP